MNLWPNFNELDEVETPKQILDEQGIWLSKGTNEVVYGVCKELDPTTTLGRRDSGFKLAFYICGKHLENYEYLVFTLHHDIIFYPLTLTLDGALASEMQKERQIKIEGQEEFNQLLRTIFNTKRIRSVLSAIISMSK